jgi:hypothetical protein
MRFRNKSRIASLAHYTNTNPHAQETCNASLTLYTGTTRHFPPPPLSLSLSTANAQFPTQNKVSSTDRAASLDSQAKAPKLYHRRAYPTPLRLRPHSTQLIEETSQQTNPLPNNTSSTTTTTILNQDVDHTHSQYVLPKAPTTPTPHSQYGRQAGTGWDGMSGA